MRYDLLMGNKQSNLYLTGLKRMIACLSAALIFAHLALAEDMSDGASNSTIPSIQPDAVKPAKNQANTVIVAVKGKISKNLVSKIKESIKLIEGDPIPAGFILLLDSSGGDGVAAMEIGRLLRKANAHIFVTGKCASACVFVLASGVVREFPPLSIGIHRGRLTISNNDAKILKDIALEDNPKYSKLLEKFEMKAKTYFNEMNISPEFYDAMQSTPSDEVHWLNNDEAIKFNLQGIDAEYLRTRSTFYQSQALRFQMDEQALVKRTAKVTENCLPFKDEQQQFMRCYRDTLSQRFPLY